MAIRKSLLCLGVLTSFTFYAQDCNLVANGNFDSYGEAWKFESQWPAFADYSTDLKGRALIQIVRFQNPQNDAKFRMVFDKLTLEKGQKYQLRFEHSSDKPDLNIEARIVDATGMEFFSKEAISPKSTTVFDQSFEFTGENGDAYVLEIKLPTDKFQFYIDNIILQNTECVKGTVGRKTTHPFLLKPKVQQNESSSVPAESKPAPKAVIKKGFSNVEISGYARFETVFRHLSKRYHTSGVDPLTDNAILTNGVYLDHPFNNGRTTGYREPMLMLEMKVQPIYNTFLKADLIIDNQMVGNIMDTSSQLSRRIEMYRYINAEVEHVKNWGTIRLKAGGVHFTNFSPLTFWAYEYRDDMFERYPWEWRNNSNEIYQQYYESKSVGRDARFANTSIGGFFLEGEKLPRNFSFKALFGKTGNTSNGFNTFTTNNYKYIQAFRLVKNIKGTDVGLNLYNQVGFFNNTNSKSTDTGEDNETIVTLSANHSNKLFTLSGELGYAKFKAFVRFESTPLAQRKVEHSPTLISRFRIDSDNLIKNVPMSLMGYYIGNGYLNINSSVMNSLPYGTTETSNSYVSTSFAKPVTELGQLASNRMGFVYTISPKIKNLKMSYGLGYSKEISPETNLNGITFQHRVAGVNRSRFWFYRYGTGPYENITNVWRRSWEDLNIVDKSIIINRPNFITIDASFKYKLKVLTKDLILTNYINYNNVYSGTTPSIWNGNNLVSYIFNDFTAFYTLNKTFTLVGQYCIEHATSDGKRLSKTLDHSSDLGTKQTGHSYGLGLDIITGARSGLYLRQKWYQHKDANYTLDEFKGFESSAEYKIFF